MAGLEEAAKTELVDTSRFLFIDAEGNPLASSYSVRVPGNWAAAVAPGCVLDRAQITTQEAWKGGGEAPRRTHLPARRRRLLR